MSKPIEFLKKQGIYPGLVMVKPHAFNQMLDPLVEDILSGGDMSNHLRASDPLVGMLGNMSVSGPLMRDLSASSRANELISLFYGDKANRRYFPLIKELYLGKVVFLPYCHTIPTRDQGDLYDAIKGTTYTFDKEGEEVASARGVRGLLGKPYLYMSNEEAATMDETSYRAAFEPVVNNYIHVCDSQPEIQAALQVLYREDELSRILCTTSEQVTPALSA